MGEKFDRVIVDEVVDAIKHFLQRQTLVQQVIKEIGLTPQEVSEWGPISWRKRDIPQSGTWGEAGEWQYFLHGIGCRITNFANGEIIDWNCSDVSAFAFNPHSFLKHLKWQVVNKGDTLAHVKKLIEGDPDGIDKLLPVVLEIQQNPQSFLQE